MKGLRNTLALLMEDLTHTARANQREDLVKPEPGSVGNGHDYFRTGARRCNSSNQFTTMFS
jgi:hypothetical protein